MSKYSIKDLEKITLQKAHTIRIWERRYGLLTPERTSTNIRYYNDAQLRKLLNVCTLLNRGMKISQISKMSKDEMDAQINHIIEEFFQGGVHLQSVINESLIAISTYNADVFNDIYNRTVENLGVINTYVRVIYPLLVRTGLLWMKEDLLPAHEHFLSHLIRQKIFTSIDALPYAKDSDETWVLFLNEEEEHEIGLLLAHYILRQHGKRVIYLGARVPYADLQNVVRACSPTHVYTFFVGSQLEIGLEQLLLQLQKDFPQQNICYSGGDDSLKELTHVHPITHIESVAHLHEILGVQAIQ